MKFEVTFKDGIKFDTDFGQKINWTMLFQLGLIGAIIRAAWEPDVFLQAVEGLLERIEEDFLTLAGWLRGRSFSGVENAVDAAREWLARWARRVGIGILVVIGITLISLVLYATGYARWLTVILIFAFGWALFFFVLIFSGRLLRLIVSPVAMFLVYCMLLAAGALAFPRYLGVPAEARVLWALATLIPSVGIVALGKRGTVLGVNVVMAYLVLQVSTPQYARQAVLKGWYTNTCAVASSGGILFYDPSAPKFGALPAGARINIRNKKPQEFDSKLVNKFLLERQTLWEVYVINSPTLEGTTGLMAANEIWQQGVSFWEMFGRSIIPYGGQKPQPPRPAATGGTLTQPTAPVTPRTVTIKVDGNAFTVTADGKTVQKLPVSIKAGTTYHISCMGEVYTPYLIDSKGREYLFQGSGMLLERLTRPYNLVPSGDGTLGVIIYQ